MNSQRKNYPMKEFRAIFPISSILVIRSAYAKKGQFSILAVFQNVWDLHKFGLQIWIQNAKITLWKNFGQFFRFHRFWSSGPGMQKLPYERISGNFSDFIDFGHQVRVCECDVSQPCVDLPDSSSSTSRMVYKSAVQVNLFSWPSHANTDKQLEGKRREFISSWKYSNFPFFSPSQQAPLVSQERLHSVVHKVAGNNKFKGKRILLIKSQQTNEHKVMTSLTHSRQIVECNNQQVYSYKYPKNSETDVIASIDQYKDSMQSVKPSGKQEERDTNLSHLHQNDVMDDAINAERVEFIASNSHTAPERSCSYEKENSYSLANVTKSFFVQMACIFMVIENMVKSVISRNLLNLKRVVGLATGASVSWECCVIAISRPTHISYAFGGKRSYAYSSLNLVVYASWLRTQPGVIIS